MPQLPRATCPTGKVSSPLIGPLVVAMEFARQSARRFPPQLDPDDAVQEVALRVWVKLRNGEEFGADGRTRSYINRAMGWQKSTQSRRARRAENYAQHAATTAAPWQAAVVPPCASLQRALASLGPLKRELLLRVAINDEELSEISEEVAARRAADLGLDWHALPAQQRALEGGKAYQTVYRRLHRARTELQELLLAG